MSHLIHAHTHITIRATILVSPDKCDTGTEGDCKDAAVMALPSRSMEAHWHIRLLHSMQALPALLLHFRLLLRSLLSRATIRLMCWLLHE